LAALGRRPEGDLHPIGDTKLVVNFSHSVAVKTAASISLCSVGMYYLLKGKEQADLEKMILGGLLVLGAMFVFY
jgi:hypothetical protein